MYTSVDSSDGHKSAQSYQHKFTGILYVVSPITILFANPDAQFLLWSCIRIFSRSLVIISRFTYYMWWLLCTMVWSHPPPDSMVETASHAFLSGYISRFGIPSLITADRCVQFEFALCQNLMSLLCTNRLELLELSNTSVNNWSWKQLWKQCQI